MAKMSNACKKWLRENTAVKIATFQSFARRLDMSIMDISTARLKVDHLSRGLTHDHDTR